MTKYIILIISILSIALADPSITGQVFDEKGNTLSYAIITNESNQNWVIAYANGWFNFNSQSNINDTLQVSRYGYHNRKLIITSKLFYNVILIQEPIDRKTVEVIGYNRYLNDNITNTFHKQLDDGNRQSIFNYMPGLMIRSYGGNAGIMTASTLGSATVNTKILFDDIDISSAQNGETDISQIPLGLVDHITSVSSPSILHGSGASNAVININQSNDKTYFSAKMGSYNFKSLIKELG